MSYLRPALGSIGFIALMLAVSAWAYTRLGDQPIAVHFDAMGHPNGFANRTQALVLLPIIAGVISLLLAALPSIMPHQSRLERSWGPYVVAWMAVLALLTVVHFGLIAHALGAELDIARLSVGGVGLLMAVIGNLLGKVRYNYVFGVRTPWTLSSERVWDRTHRFAGWAVTLGGLVALILALIAPSGGEDRLHFALLICVLCPAFAAVVYSYFESRRQR